MSRKIFSLGARASCPQKRAGRLRSQDKTYLEHYTYFFTVVTYQRRPFLTEPIFREMLRSMIVKTRENYPFEINAWVLLPDHLHCVWTATPLKRNIGRRGLQAPLF
ncbi:transposase [Deltaproteobacteria bacterium TL4]